MHEVPVPKRARVVLLLLAAAVAAAVGLSRRAPGELTASVARAPLPPTTSREDLARTLVVARARLSADPGDTAAGSALAEALLRRARVESDAALAVEAEQVLQRVLREAPSDYQARRLLGVVYLAQHRFAEAARAAERARDLRPRDAYNYGVLGDAALELGRYEEAFEAFDAMVRLRPSASAYARIAYAHELQGRLQEALKYMRMAAEATSAHDPESLAWHYAQLGNLHLQLGELAAARREFARAGHAFPEHPYARLGQARAEAARGNHAEALARYSALLREAPTPELAASVGDLLAIAGDPAGAHSLYARAEALERAGWENEEPQPAALARFLAERSLKVEEAVRLAEQAAANRADIFTMDALAWAYYRAGRFEEARHASARARRTGTADRRILYHAAAIEHARGRDDEARRLLRRVVDAGPTFDLVAGPEAAALSRALGVRR